jgi:hypothetical protein
VFGAKSKEIVTTGNCPWCAMLRGLDFFSRRAIAESGIGDDAEADVAAAPPVSEGLEEG